MTDHRKARNQLLELRSERVGDTHTIYLVGELDIATSPGLAREFDWIELGDAKTVVIDLSELTFIDSEGISLLLRAGIGSGLGSSSVTVVGARGQVRRVMERTGVSELLNLVD